MSATSARCLLLWLLLLFVAQQAAAERVVGMSKRVYDHIAEVQELFDKDEWTAGIEKLDALRKIKLSSYERAHVLNMTGFAWYQLDDLERAMATYREALAQADLPVSQVRGLLTTISQLALMAEDYPAAERYSIQLVELKGEVPTDPAAWVVLAQARIGQENYAGALAPLLTAIAAERDKGRAPRENWLVLLSSVYYMNDDFTAMRSVLYELVALYPKEKYLLNLAALHGQLGDSEKQLALVESLLDDQRLKKGNHLLSLANLFLAHGLPYKAAALLEREMKSGRIETTRRNLELESQAWYMAGEEARAIPPLEAAAAIAEDSSMHMRVARLYMDNYDWAGAESASRIAVETSDKDDLGEALLLLGMAMAGADKLEEARSVFDKAALHEDTAQLAQQWLGYIDNEQRRMAALQ